MKTTNRLYRDFFFLCLLFIIAGSCQAQKLRLNAYGSYVFDGMYHIHYPDGGLYKGTIDHEQPERIGMRVAGGARADPVDQRVAADRHRRDVSHQRPGRRSSGAASLHLRRAGQ